jgi:hypothetical protein
MAARSTAQSGPVMTPGGGTNQARSAASATTSCAGRQVAEMERTLRSAGDRTRYMETLTVLRRWQFDTMLDGASRERARGLVWEFEPNGWDEV